MPYIKILHKTVSDCIGLKRILMDAKLPYSFACGLCTLACELGRAGENWMALALSWPRGTATITFAAVYEPGGRFGDDKERTCTHGHAWGQYTKVVY